jgi:hypothetical protein
MKIQQATNYCSPSTEAGYKALANGTIEVLWPHYLLSDLCFSPSFVIIIWCDNLGATYLSTNLIFHTRTEVDYHFFFVIE